MKHTIHRKGTRFTLIALLVLAGLSIAVAAPGRSVQAARGAGCGVPGSEQPLDFERAQIITLRSNPPQYALRVSGTNPYQNMTVALVPHVYVVQPDYWGIAVIGCMPGISLPALAPYAVTIPLAGITGTEGVEVIGATRRQQLAVPPKAAAQVMCRDWAAWLNEQPLAPRTLHVTGECVAPTPGYTVTLRRHSPQGINPRNLLLELVVRPPTGSVAQVPTPVTVRYEEKTTSGFDTVTILPEGVTIPVRVVS
jgi:hypothetical protein